MKKTTKSKTASALVKEKSKLKKTVPAVTQDAEYSEDDSMLAAPSVTNPTSKYLFTAIAVFIIAALALYKFSYVIIPAKVGNQPIFIWQYVSFMHKTYGKEAMQTLTTQSVINQEIAKSGVTVKPEDIQKQVDLLDQQASSSGGLQAMLAAQQMTLDQLKDQIRIQLAVKQILKDKISVTDTEVQAAYAKDKDFFKGVPQAEALQQVRDQLENQKFQTEAGTWLANVRKAHPVVILFPGLQ